MNPERRPGHHQATRIGTQEDYAALAALAEETGKYFVLLAERFEAGTETVEAIREDICPSDWLTHDEAERLIPGIYDAMRKFSTPAIRRKLNSSRRAVSLRGCGWLWNRRDLERLRKISRECRMRTLTALRAMDAIHRGLA